MEQSIIHQAEGIFSFDRLSRNTKNRQKETSFFRKGTSGDWEHYLSESDLEYFNSQAGKILRDHLAIYLDYQVKESLLPAVEQEAGFGIENKSEYLEKSVESMGLSVRALKCLKR